MFRLQRRAVDFTRIRDKGGQKSLTFEVNTALRLHSPIRRPSSQRRQNVFKSLRYLRPGAKVLRRQLRGCLCE
jgi:hypothetical protein